MSKVKIQGNAGGTGLFTVAAPATNTDRTLTLPDETGNIITTGSSGNVTAAMLASTLNLSSKTVTLPTDMANKVLQVITVTGNTTFASSASSYVDTPQVASITPKRADSKIIVQMINAIWSSSNSYMYLRIVASGGASGTICEYGDFYQYYYGNTPIFAEHANHNTTSTITYTLQGRTPNGSGWYAPNNNTSPSPTNRYHTFLWEIAP